MSIIKEARELYHQSVNDAYKRGHIWDQKSQNYKDLKRIIDTVETPEEVIEELRKTDMYAITIRDDKRFKLMMDWNKRLADKRSVDYESTPNLFKMAFYCDDITDVFGTTIGMSVLELGGGNGQFAKVAQERIEPEVYIDIDIPESLYMAYVCLRHWFPNKKALWITDEIDIYYDAYDFIFIPVGKEKCIEGRSIELFVNTASMGEMDNENIRYWMDFLQNKINLECFFGFNRFLNTVEDNEAARWNKTRQRENEASVLFDKRWEVCNWEVEPDFARCPYEDPRIARYLEIALTRTEEDQKPESIEDITFEDWWAYRKVGALGTHRHNQLVNDYTQKGTLFRLWDAIRLGNKEAVPMVLEYFKHIGRAGYKFEEEYFYQKML